jgi:hypothetical protein
MEIGEMLEWLIRFAQLRRDQLRALHDSADIDVVCAFSAESGQAGFVLDATVLRQLGELGLDLVVDLFPPTREDGPDLNPGFV